MQNINQYRPDLTLDLIIDQWPVVIPLFIEMHLLCIGCPISSFHTLDDACREHGVDIDPFMTRFLNLIQPSL